MHCPSCGSDVYATLDTRDLPVRVRRRKKCHACGTRWTTYEIDADMLIALYDGRVDSLSADAQLALRRIVDQARPGRRKKRTRRPPRGFKQPESAVLKMRATKRGFYVPADKEADWRTIRSKGFSLTETATMLGLRPVSD